MENQDIRAIGFATLLVAAATTLGDTQAAQAPLPVIPTAAGGQTETQVALPRARPELLLARLQDAGHTEFDADRRQVPLPRPRPLYFDLRIDMTDMLSADALAGKAYEEQVAEARGPLDDPQDPY